MDYIVMKALKTFRGTNGYIPAGSEFFCTDQAMADMYVRQGLATFTDESNNINQVYAGQPIDLKNIAQARLVNETANKKEFKFSEMERNVTSMAKPIELKVSVNGINPNDVDVQIVADTNQKPEEKYVSQNQVEGPNVNRAPQNYQTQSQNQGYQTQEFKQDYEKQNVQSQESYAHEAKEKELIAQLEHIQRELEALHQEGGASQSLPQSQESPVFEVRHIGGGWYDLPNGERVQGKANAEARINELAQTGQVDGGQASGQGGSSFPNPDRVAQVNAQPQDGASLYRAQQEAQGGLVGGGVSQSGGNNFNGGNFSTGGNQGGNYGSVSSQGGNSGGNYGGNQVGSNANTQPRNSEGQFVDTGVGRTAGATGTSGNTGGSAGGSGSTGSGGASTSGNTSGSSGSGGSGGSGGGGTSGASGGSSGASTSGNTNQ